MTVCNLWDSHTQAPVHAAICEHTEVASLGSGELCCTYPCKGAISADKVILACRYYLQGYCREGTKCRFGHHQQDTGMGFSASQALPAAHSPFSLAAPTQMPSVTTLVDSNVTFQTGPAMTPSPSASQALADPVMRSNYGSAAGFFSDVSSAVSTAGLLQPARPSILDVGGVDTLFSTAMPGRTLYAPSTPTEACNRQRMDPQPAQKQSPFPGMGAGVPGSCSFKHAGSLHDIFDIQPTS